MSQQALLTRVVETLGRCGAEYLVTGSVASSLQGEPRSFIPQPVDLDADSTIEIVLERLNRTPYPGYDFPRNRTHFASIPAIGHTR